MNQHAPAQQATTSPNVYETAVGHADKNLVEPGDDIDTQPWLAPARDSKTSTWTAPGNR